MVSDDLPSPMREVLIHYGADLTRVREYRWDNVHCPFHDDRNASARVNLADGAFACLACDIKGDAWKLIMEREGLSFVEALEFARDRLGVDHGRGRGTAREAEPWRPSWLEL